MTDRIRMHISGRGPRDLAAHVFRPEPARSLRTAVILLHGGAWRFGSAEAMVPYAEALARLGFVAIAAEYRLLGEAPWPAQLDDVWDAIAWTRSQSGELGIDADKIALQGFSAGGHLALLAAGRCAERPECGVAAVISLFAPPRLDGPTPPGLPSLAVALLGPAATPAEVLAATPIHHVREGFPPTFLLSGMSDFLVTPAATLELHQALAAAHVDVDLHLYHGHTHEFAALPSMLEPVHAEIATFLRRSVVDRAAHIAENLELNPFARPNWGPPPGREKNS